MTPSGMTPSGMNVLVTGGTKGLGLATALAFGRHLKARAILTYKWGSADEDELARQFAAFDLPAPICIQADVAKKADTDALFAKLAKDGIAIDALIANASAAVTVQSVADLNERAFLQSMAATAWPLVEYALAAKRHLGRYPRYIVAMSSDGPDRFTPGYDYVASGKAAMETLVRYLAYRLRGEDVRVNALRSRALRTDALASTLGDDFDAFLSKRVPEELRVTPEDVANTCVMMCSGALDAMTAQVLTCDRGATFLDGASYLFTRREEIDL